MAYTPICYPQDPSYVYCYATYPYMPACSLEVGTWDEGWNTHIFVPPFKGETPFCSMRLNPHASYRLDFSTPS